MSLPYQREVVGSLEFVAALCNARREDGVTTAAELRSITTEHGFPNVSRTTRADAERVFEAIPALERLWDAGRDEAAAMVNRIFRETRALPELARHDSLTWHLHGLPRDRPLVERVLVDSAMAFVDLIRLDDTERCKRCDDAVCERMFFDQSRNRSRRFCSTTCQSRTNVALFRARRAAGSGGALAVS